MKGLEAKDERARQAAWNLIRERLMERTGLERIENLKLEDIQAGVAKYQEVSDAA
jgi:hypothetical protein